MSAGDPVVSADAKKADAKKKENAGQFKNGGRECQPKGSPARVRDLFSRDPTPGDWNYTLRPTRDTPEPD